MKEANVVVAEKREKTGSGECNRLRKTGWLPCVVYGEKGDVTSLKLNRHAFGQMLRHHTSETVMFDLAIGQGAQPTKVLLKEVQHDSVTEELLHVDFMVVSMTKKMRVHIALRFVGDPVGVLTEGGVLDYHMRSVEVECLPSDLVELIEMDVSGLHVGQTLVAGDLKVGPGLTVVTGKDVAIVSVSALKLEEEAKPAEGEVAAGEAKAEPEVIKPEKKEKEAEE